jgi:AcrR family transcriptional regulator
MEERILNKTKELFFTYGIRSVTMDDIAKEMGMSKKTIYQFFSDKNEIVEKAIGDLIENHGEKIQISFNEAENAIHEVCLQIRNLSEIFQSIKPGIFFEVQKYFPDTWEKVKGHKYQCVLQGIVKNLERGVSETLYRPYMDIKTISHIRLQQLNSVLNQHDFPAANFDYRYLLNQISELYLYGIASLNGQKLIAQYLNTNN